MSDYRIVPALPEHAPFLSQLARSVAFDAETADPNQGFLVFLGTPAEYAFRLEHGPDSVLALAPRGKPAGFLLTGAGIANRPDALVIEQIAVAPAARGAGLAQRMFDAVLTAARPRVVAASIMHAPVKNLRSIRFFTEKNGFSLVGSYKEETIEWGYYERQY